MDKQQYEFELELLRAFALRKGMRKLRREHKAREKARKEARRRAA